MKYKLLILSFVFFVFNLKSHAQECPEIQEIVVTIINRSAPIIVQPTDPIDLLTAYFMSLNIGPSTQLIAESYEDIVIEGTYTANGGAQPIGTPINITYEKAGWWTDGINYYVQYFNPVPFPDDLGKPAIDINNFTVPSFGPGLPGPCTYINGVLPIEEFHQLKDISFYPNPIKKGSLLHFNTQLSADVFDITGKIVLKFENTKTANISDLSQGIYMIKMLKDDKIFTRKLIVTD